MLHQEPRELVLLGQPVEHVRPGGLGLGAPLHVRRPPELLGLVVLDPADLGQDGRRVDRAVGLGRHPAQAQHPEQVVGHLLGAPEVQVGRPRERPQPGLQVGDLAAPLLAEPLVVLGVDEHPLLLEPDEVAHRGHQDVVVHARDAVLVHLAPQLLVEQERVVGVGAVVPHDPLGVPGLVVPLLHGERQRRLAAVPVRRPQVGVVLRRPEVPGRELLQAVRPLALVQAVRRQHGVADQPQAVAVVPQPVQVELRVMKHHAEAGHGVVQLHEAHGAPAPAEERAIVQDPRRQPVVGPPREPYGQDLAIARAQARGLDVHRDRLVGRQAPQSAAQRLEHARRAHQDEVVVGRVHDGLLAPGHAPRVVQVISQVAEPVRRAQDARRAQGRDHPDAAAPGQVQHPVHPAPPGDPGAAPEERCQGHATGGHDDRRPHPLDLGDEPVVARPDVAGARSPAPRRPAAAGIRVVDVAGVDPERGQGLPQDPATAPRERPLLVYVLAVRRLAHDHDARVVLAAVARHSGAPGQGARLAVTPSKCYLHVLSSHMDLARGTYI